ncbi:uncharacterized protein LOC131638161 [Vicia villosa]|uniref:uncharacterized protein LOC131638161 n=1 Tax=Vicia villosa TaxID=3911 RepID=UPI00273AA28E|nr:uncharacterized protein LOC131638161 [Vicia villosa]
MNSEFENLFAALTDEQRGIYEKIMQAVESLNPAVFFLHGYGGTGKTYMWRTLATALRSKHDICLTVATSGIASLLLPGGEGRISEPNDGTAEIDIPPDILITEFDDPIVAIINTTYPDFLNNFQSVDYLKSRAILASTLEIVDQINAHILNLMPVNNAGEIRDYYSANSVDKSEIYDPTVVDILTPEFLSSLRTSGLPNHHLKLKVGTPIMLMRNIDQSEGLCNGTRLCITKMAAHVLEASIMGGKGLENLGQSLDNVGLYLPRDVFTHGQIYVALSRVRTKKGIKILIHDEEKKFKGKTTNVVYKEVFNNV